MKVNKITIVIADDHPLIRHGIKDMLSSEKNLKVVAEATNGIELLKIVQQFEPDIVITDINMPAMDGFEAVKKIMVLHPNTNIIVITVYNKEQYFLEMIDAGALGYILKGAGRTEIVAAINAVIRKEYYISSCFRKPFLRRLSSSKNDPYPGKTSTHFLSDRDKNIIRMVCEGKNSEQIAAQLKLSPRSVGTYRQQILDKLDLPNSSALAIYAVKTGIYNIDD